MKRPRTASELCDLYGVKVPGGKKVPSFVIQYLLQDRTDEELCGLALIALLAKCAWIPHRPFAMPEFDLGDLG